MLNVNQAINIQPKIESYYEHKNHEFDIYRKKILALWFFRISCYCRICFC